jgi:hypothetical protein
MSCKYCDDSGGTGEDEEWYTRETRVFEVSLNGQRREQNDNLTCGLETEFTQDFLEGSIEPLLSIMGGAISYFDHFSILTDYLQSQRISHQFALWNTLASQT